jgi:uncharacterized Ntn-hydrolase superfamily protein
MIDARGRVAVHTGAKCIPMAGHVTGDDYSVQANLMESGKVWPAMAQAFRSTKGDLAGRVLAALDAAQAAGGDIRGRQSAALIVGIRQSKPPGRRAGLMVEWRDERRRGECGGAAADASRGCAVGGGV